MPMSVHSGRSAPGQDHRDHDGKDEEDEEDDKDDGTERWKGRGGR